MSDPDRLAELHNAVGAQLVPGVLFDELFEIAERALAEVARLRALLAPTVDMTSPTIYDPERKEAPHPPEEG